MAPLSVGWGTSTTGACRCEHKAELAGQHALRANLYVWKAVVQRLSCPRAYCSLISLHRRDCTDTARLWNVADARIPDCNSYLCTSCAPERTGHPGLSAIPTAIQHANIISRQIIDRGRSLCRSRCSTSMAVSLQQQRLDAPSECFPFWTRRPTPLIPR